MLTVLRFVFAIIRLSSGMLSRCRIWSSIKDRNGDITTRTLETRGFSNRASAAITTHSIILKIYHSLSANLQNYFKFAKYVFLFS